MKQKLTVDLLKPGMYVSELDRPWLESPFLFQGFILENDDDVRAVSEVCEWVYVDPEKGRDAPPPRPAVPEPLVSAVKWRERQALPVTVPFEVEIEQARRAHQDTRQQVDRMFHDVRLGKNLDVAGARAVVSEMVNSVVRNPDAQLWLSNLRKRDEYTAIHSLNVCIFALAFGRHLGFVTDELNELGIGALLHDIGKMRIPLEILNKESALDEEEKHIIREHANHGYAILKQHAKQLPASALEVAYSHHERVHGKGYPRGLKREQTHLFARVVSIVDVYDAITSDRVYHHGMDTLAALKDMFDSRGHELDEELVEQFIQCIGIYPIGSVVELNSEEVGIVVSTPRGNHLTPRVIVVRDAMKKPVFPPPVLDLSRFRDSLTGRRLEIRRVIKPETYNIDLHTYIREQRFSSTQ